MLRQSKQEHSAVRNELPSSNSTGTISLLPAVRSDRQVYCRTISVPFRNMKLSSGFSFCSRCASETSCSRHQHNVYEIYWVPKMRSIIKIWLKYNKHYSVLNDLFQLSQLSSLVADLCRA